MGHQYKDRYNMQAHIDKHKAKYSTNPTLVGTVSVPKLQWTNYIPDIYGIK
jgi:hypothetical protein